jgi:hypothetical protein
MNDLSSVNPHIINFDLTEDQLQLTAYALEAATGQNPHTNAFTVEDVARAIILLRGGAYFVNYEDYPDYTNYADHDYYVTNYMDGVAELDRLVGPVEWHDELAPVAVGEGNATTVTITITH